MLKTQICVTRPQLVKSSDLTSTKAVIISVRKIKYKIMCVILKYGSYIPIQVLFQKMGLFSKYLSSYASIKKAECAEKLTGGYPNTRGADKSLARPGRKQVTMTKLQLLQGTQKKIQKIVHPTQPSLHGSNDLRVGRKMATFQYFSVRSG